MPAARAALDHWILHEAFRTWPGVLPRDHPEAGVAALGPLAERIVHPHPFHYGYGPGTPFARIREAGAQILVLGAPLDTITLLHHAEQLAEIPSKRVICYRRFMPSPDGPQWLEFEEVDTSEPVHTSLPANCFERTAKDFLAAHQSLQAAAGPGPNARPVAKAAAYLFPAPELVRFAVRWIETFRRQTLEPGSAVHLNTESDTLSDCPVDQRGMPCNRNVPMVLSVLRESAYTTVG